MGYVNNNMCIVHRLDSNLWKILSLKSEGLFILTPDFSSLARIVAQTRMDSEKRILNFGFQNPWNCCRQVDHSLFSNPKTGRSWTRWWTWNRPRMSRSCKEQFRPKVTNGFVQKWRLAMMLNCNCERPTIILLCNFHLRFWRKCCGLQGEIRIGGLSHGRTAGIFQVKVLYRVILTYQPNGSRGIQSKIFHIKFEFPGSPSWNPSACSCVHLFPPPPVWREKKSFGFDIASC